MKDKKFTVIDLFSGCGGLSYGLQEAGFDVLLGIDNWQNSLDTFLYNHKNAKILEGDISEVDSKEIKKIAGKKIDVIVGGPPCQGFSLSGPRNFYDKRNRLYIEFLRIVKDLKPKAFLIENVPGLAALFNGEVKERIIEEFSKLGYAVNAQILNASDYGVPQNRRRIVFVGIKGNKKFEFPAPTHFEIKNHKGEDVQKKITVSEAIGDLPLLDKSLGAESSDYVLQPISKYQKKMRSGSNVLLNHVASLHKQQTIETIKLVPQGGNYKNLPSQYKNTRNVHVARARFHNNKPAPTIDTGHRHHFHPIANRVQLCGKRREFNLSQVSLRFLVVKHLSINK